VSRAESAGSAREERGGRRSLGFAETFAAIDLGTNNCRLLIARPARRGFRVIDSFSRIVRLGEGVSLSGELSETAMLRTMEALKICAEKMARKGVTFSRCVATDACRRAGNHEQFVERVRRDIGLKLEVIGTDEEARLALTGCLPLFSKEQKRALLFDIGGGSTEISWVALPEPGGGNKPEIIDWLSLPYGVVNLAERYCEGAVFRDDYEEMAEEIAERLRPFEESNAISARVASGEVQMLGTSGTVTTLAGVHQKLPKYQRQLIDGYRIDFTSLERAIDQVADMTLDERAAHPCIGPERADLVLAGCAILQGICRSWPVGRLRVADRGLREGILLGLMAEARRHRGRPHHRNRPCAPAPQRRAQ
jgi:exopolyphosphatase/guanosine-5'-triphosphate,3'-diphosphate pyrophosphatase